MPSFLSKLLGRKKVQEPEPSTDKRGSPTSLLEGKFEAVSPTVSPSAALFTDSGAAQVRGNDKAKDKESPFNLLRYKSRPSSDSPTTENPIAGRALDVVFEPGHEAIALLDESAIGERRLSPDEALSLVRACSQVIIERGLETLGIMHPHWHSASLEHTGEANGSSGSRLSRFLGLWLLTAEHSPEGDDWATFYDRWDRAGRILEHLFLARIRDEAHKLPRRLTELVEHYPYASDPDASDDNLLEYIGALSPSHILYDSSQTPSTLISEKHHSFLIPQGALAISHTRNPYPIFLTFFSDETIRLLSLIPADVSDKTKHAPTFVLLSPISPGRPRSFSLPESPRDPTQVDHSRAPPPGQPAAAPNPNANPSTAPTTASPETPTDWLQFSSQGFGTISPTRDIVATLWDNDVEVTVPPPAPVVAQVLSAGALPTLVRRLTATLITRVKLNEAFVDFWADALLDPISKPWLRFVLCQLKPIPSVVASPTPTPTPTWLIIEQRFVRHAPVQPPKEEVETPYHASPPSCFVASSITPR
ncbi:hypothetical protein EDB83DRAFT_2595587 [Lactarius deliciosus]|nr:hypothetical protein EDB83DRAFT_2595587 [Lactarius deliciosus]